MRFKTEIFFIFEQNELIRYYCIEQDFLYIGDKASRLKRFYKREAYSKSSKKYGNLIK